MREFRVDTELLVGSVTNIETAVDQLADAGHVLDAVNDRLQSSGTMSQGTEADDAFAAFRDRWKDEFGLIADMLAGFREAVGNAAEAYDRVDREWAAGIRGEAGGLQA